jgi:hypothetical protein
LLISKDLASSVQLMTAKTPCFFQLMTGINSNIPN